MNKRFWTKAIISVALSITSLGCVMREHYFEAQSAAGKVMRGWCGGRYGPPSTITLSFGGHQPLVIAQRSNENVVKKLNYSIPSSTVLVKISIWLKQGESLSLDPATLHAADNRRSSLNTVMPVFVLKQYISPVDPDVSRKVQPAIVELVEGKVSMVAPSTHRNTIAEIYIQVNTGLLNEFSVQLPPIEIGGMSYEFPDIHFQEKEGTFFVPGFNC